MGVRYQYSSPRGFRSGRIKNITRLHSQKIIVAAVVLVAILALSFGGATITSFVTKSQATQRELADAKTQVLNLTLQQETCASTVAQAKKTADQAGRDATTCAANLGTTTSQLSSCSSERQTLDRRVNDLSSQYATCDQDRTTYKTQVGQELAKQAQLVRVAVRAVCCSFSDVQANTQRPWAIDNATGIVCSGNYTVSCGTGETNF